MLASAYAWAAGRLTKKFEGNLRYASHRLELATRLISGLKEGGFSAASTDVLAVTEALSSPLDAIPLLMEQRTRYVANVLIYQLEWILAVIDPAADSIHTYNGD